MSTKVITPQAMLSYPHLAEPQAARKPGQKAKYSASLVFAPGADLSALRAAAEEAAVEKFGANAVQRLKTGGLKSPFRTDVEEKGYAEGSTFINVRTEQKPGMVYLWAGPDGKPAIIPDNEVEKALYPGSLVRASLRAFAYDTDGNRGVSFALNNIQKLGDGPRIDGRKAATEEFEADLSVAPASLEDAGAE